MPQVNMSSVVASGAGVFAQTKPKASNDIYARYLKRAFDLVLATFVAVPLAIIVAVLATLIRLNGSSPFFGHVRVGANGKPFVCWKLRTMDGSAGQELAVYLAANPAAASEWARDHKLENDPRVTRIGQFLRKTSLDELPQIWNVLRGDMSFVGPRPIVHAELAKYGRHSDSYLAGRPGVTGLWQVSGRNAISYNQRVSLDVEYRTSTTFRGDISILFGTVGAVVKGSGC